MWQSIELRELRVFLTLAEELHFGHTADRLHMTPSRVSQLMRELESKLGMTLVHRTRRRVSLTTARTRLLSEVGAVYEDLLAVLERS